MGSFAMLFFALFHISRPNDYEPHDAHCTFPLHTCERFEALNYLRGLLIHRSCEVNKDCYYES
jgi:hypothetical protein